MSANQAKQDEMAFFNNAPADIRYDEFDEAYYQEIFDSIKLPAIPKNKILLDVGCASGAWGIRFAKNGYSVVGVDISKTLVKSAKAWANSAGVNFMPILCDAERLPFKEEAFDLCFCGYVLHHFKHLEQIVSELSRNSTYPRENLCCRAKRHKHN